jgi:hypothetical protein
MHFFWIVIGKSSKRRTCASQKDLPNENEYLDYRFNNHRKLGGLAGLTSLTMGIGQDKALAATNNQSQMNLAPETPAANGMMPNGQI